MTDANDGSDSESESSYSSSEEALARCEGIVGNFNLERTEDCGTGDLTLYFNATVNVSGYYYFIFGSENEKRDNFIQAHFELEKYEYELPEALENCTDVKECQVTFDLASSQKVKFDLSRQSENCTKRFSILKYNGNIKKNCAASWFSNLN